MNTPMVAAMVQHTQAWNSPESTRISRQDAITQMMPSPAAIAISAADSPSSAKLMEMPSDGTQGTITCAIQRPSPLPAIARISTASVAASVTMVTQRSASPRPLPATI